MDNKINITLNLFLEIKDSDIYGGLGTIGYAESIADFVIDEYLTINVKEYAEEQIKGFAEFCRVPVENVRIISRYEYESNTDD